MKKILEKIKNFFSWNIYRHIQKLFTGYSFDMKFDADYHMAKKIFPIFKDYYQTKSYLDSWPVDLFDLLSEEDKLLYDSDDKAREKLENLLESKWKDIIEKVYHALEFIVNGADYPEEFYENNPEYNPDLKKDGLIRIGDTTRLNTKVRLNKKKVAAFENKINEGFELLGKYWRNFWI